MHNLDRIDPSREWLRLVERMTALISAPYMDEIAEFFGAVCYAPFEKAVGLEIRIVALHVHVTKEENRVALLRGTILPSSKICTNHSQATFRQKQRAESFPVAWLSGGPGNDVVKRGHKVIYR